MMIIYPHMLGSLIFSFIGLSFSYGQFIGGNADGHANIRITNIPCAITTVNLFGGGVADGHANIRITNIPCPITTVNFFGGGVADGHANLRILGVGYVTCAALPIELISFTANCDNHDIILKWSTASETNNDYFTLEQSENAINWIIIGTVDGAGNSSTILNYTFKDTKPYNETSYYQLKQTDFDGKFENSNVISVVNCKEDLTENNLIIYPNPANGIFYFLFSGDKEQVYSIEIFNVLGERVFYSRNYQTIIDLSDKQNGIYLVHFNLDQKIITKKIVIEM